MGIGWHPRSISSMSAPLTPDTAPSVGMLLHARHRLTSSHHYDDVVMRLIAISVFISCASGSAPTHGTERWGGPGPPIWHMGPEPCGCRAPTWGLPGCCDPSAGGVTRGLRAWWVAHHPSWVSSTSWAFSRTQRRVLVPWIARIPCVGRVFCRGVQWHAPLLLLDSGSAGGVTL
jgi:hypothetical protein